MPQKCAIRSYGSGVLQDQITYAELVARMNRVSHASRSHWGLKPGDCVAIAALNSIDFIALTCGMGAIGVTVAKPNPKLAIREILAICADADVQVLLCEPHIAEAVREKGTQSMRVCAVGEELNNILSDADDAPPKNADLADENSVFVMPYTSGTTGEPKGVCVTHRSRSLTFFGMGVEYGCYGPEDRFLGLAPLCHGAGFSFNIAPLYFGGSLDLYAKFDPEQTLEHIGRGDVTGIFLVPTHFQAFFALDEVALSKSRGHKLKSIISNAAPLTQSIKECIVEHFGEGLLHECYGSTEAGIVTSMRPADQLRKIQCVGRPFINTSIRIVGDDGEDVVQGEVGELFSRSPYLFAGYRERPEETQKSMRDGWVSAGDLARQDEEGFYYIVGRKKEMIISGGINIYPREVESVLEEHPSIAESAVVGMPDEYWGERIVAAITLAKGANELDETILTDWCVDRIGNQKVPKQFVLLEAFPRNAMGKVLKSEIAKFLTPCREDA
jgi:long-chain acyl-CoA synthetase